MRERLAGRGASELAQLFEQAGLPFAPIRKPEDLYDDAHLLATGGLADVRLPDGDQGGPDGEDDACSRSPWRGSDSACDWTRRDWASTPCELLTQMGYSDCRDRGDAQPQDRGMTTA